MTFIADTMTLETERSRREFSGSRHTYACPRQLWAALESLACGYPIWPDARFHRRQRCARVCAKSTGAVTCALTATGVHQPKHLHRLPRQGSSTPSAFQPRRRRSTSTATFKTGTNKCRYRRISMARTVCAPKTSNSDSSAEGRKHEQSRCPGPVACATACAVPGLRVEVLDSMNAYDHYDSRAFRGRVRRQRELPQSVTCRRCSSTLRRRRVCRW